MYIVKTNNKPHSNLIGKIDFESNLIFIGFKLELEPCDLGYNVKFINYKSLQKFCHIYYFLLNKNPKNLINEDFKNIIHFFKIKFKYP